MPEKALPGMTHSFRGTPSFRRKPESIQPEAVVDGRLR